MTDARDPKDLLPLSPPVYHVLLALGADAMHGYAIMQAFPEKTGGSEETSQPNTDDIGVP